MVFDSHISAAVAAAASTAFIGTLLVAVLLLLTTYGLTRKVIRLRGDLRTSETRYNKYRDETVAASVRRERVIASLLNANEDLKLQRRVLGFALFDAVDENEALAAETRSANRRRLAAETRAAGYAGEIDKLSTELRGVRETLDMTQSMFCASQAEKRRLRRQVESLETELWDRDVEKLLDNICPVKPISETLRELNDYLLPDEQLFVSMDVSDLLSLMIGSDSVIEHKDGTFTHTINLTGGTPNPTI